MLAIILLLVIAFTVGGIELYILKQSQSQAINLSVPTLIQSQKLEGVLSELLVLQGRVREAKSSTAIESIQQRMNQLTAQINDTLGGVGQLQGSAKLLQIAEKFSLLDESNASILQLWSSAYDSGKTLAAMRQLIVSLRGRFRDVVEPKLVGVEISLSDALTSIENNDLDQEASSLTIRRQVETQNTLTEISFRFLSVINNAMELSRENENSIRLNDTTQLSFNIKSIAQLLTTLESSDYRNELAGLASELRTVVLGGNGLLEEVNAKLSYQRQFLTLQEQQTELVTTVSKDIDDVVNSARKDISDSTLDFEKALFRTTVILILSGLLITAVALLLSYYVVERQINQRIDRLTKAVLHIAQGDTDYSVGVSGGDEIGMMAASLEVFKSTALELQISNKELEQFAYAAAHDLRSPLRAIENLVQWTLEDMLDELPGECIVNLNKILGRTKRLSTLQADLLEYARAGHSEFVVERLDIRLMLDELIELLNPGKKFDIKLSSELRYFDTYVTPFRQVLLNLINNAIKHHDSGSGVITIGISNEGGRVSVSVLDDGPGIEEKFQAQIFDLFSRLQSQDDVEGSGLGLALVQKLVGRYGGTISISSNPQVQRGAELRFDWPVFEVV